MAGIPGVAIRGPTEAPQNHPTVLRQLKEAVEIGQRNRDSALDWLACVESTDAGVLPGRIDEILRRRPVSAVVLVTGPHAATASLRAWRRWAPVTVARAA